MDNHSESAYSADGDGRADVGVTEEIIRSGCPLVCSSFTAGENAGLGLVKDADAMSSTNHDVYPAEDMIVRGIDGHDGLRLLQRSTGHCYAINGDLVARLRKAHNRGRELLVWMTELCIERTSATLDAGLGPVLCGDDSSRRAMAAAMSRDNSAGATLQMTAIREHANASAAHVDLLNPMSLRGNWTIDGDIYHIAQVGYFHGYSIVPTSKDLRVYTAHEQNRDCVGNLRYGSARETSTRASWNTPSRSHRTTSAALSNSR